MCVYIYICIYVYVCVHININKKYVGEKKINKKAEGKINLFKILYNRDVKISEIKLTDIFF